MSLILEALRKSEQQRLAGQPPTLISESVWASRRVRVGDRRDRGASWLVLAPLLLLALAAGWWFGVRQPVPPPVATTGPEAAKEPATAEPSGAAPTPRTAPSSAPPPAAQVERQARETQAATTAKPRAAPVESLPVAREPTTADSAIGTFVNSPELQIPKPPTSEMPYVPPEAALPELLAEPKPDGGGLTQPTLDAARPSATGEPAPQPAAPAAAMKPIEPVVGTAAPPRASVASSDPAAAPPAGVAATAPPARPSGASTGAHPPGGTTLPAAGVRPEVTGTGLPMVYELPLATRQTLPAFKVSMHVYSNDPAQRFVIIDGKRLNEGGPIDNDLNLAEILPDGVVLEYRGQRFVVPRSRY